MNSKINKTKSMMFDVRRVVSLGVRVLTRRGHREDFWSVGKVPFLEQLHRCGYVCKIHRTTALGTLHFKIVTKIVENC